MGRGWARLVPVTQITNLTLTAGERRETTLGGQGRRVVGRVVVKNYDKPIDWQDHVFWMESLSPAPPDCPSFEAATNEFHEAWKAAKNEAEGDAAEDRYLAEEDRIARKMGAYYATPAGRRYWFSKRSYVLQFEPDGTFRIEDVPGGKYELTIDARELDAKRGQRKSPMIAIKQQIIDVPGSAGGREETPLDLGVIDLLAQLRPGDQAPEFNVKTLEGQSVKLSDYKGKFVLLDFWATWSAASLAELGELKETCAAFAGDPRFAMIGLNLDADPAAARAFVNKNGIGWKQGLLGPWTGNAVAERYGVEGAPFVFMIDTNGRVLMTGLKGGNIKSAVHVALTARD